jgi:hypothetical protein
LDYALDATGDAVVSRPSTCGRICRLVKAAPGTKSTIGRCHLRLKKGKDMNNIIYLVGLVVVVIAVLSFFGLG